MHGLPDWTVREHDRVLFGVFEDYFSSCMKPDPTRVLALNPEVHGLDLLCVYHCARQT